MSEGDAAAIETGWRIHGALCDWTGKVDSKATFLSAIDVAVLAGIVALRGDGHQLADLRGAWQNAAFAAGSSFLVLATFLVLMVVTPQLGKSKLFQSEAEENFIFFGHLKHWDPEQLAAALKDRNPMPTLSRQLVVMSKIAWRKHRLLQASVWFTVLGSLLVGAAAAMRQLSAL